MKWWKRTSKSEPRLTDDHFNAALDHHLQCILAVLADPTSDLVPMAVVIRGSGKDIHVFANMDEEEDFDLNKLTADFAQSARDGQLIPQAIMFAFLSGSQGGEECIISHGATPDGRVNAAMLGVTRDSDGFLQSGRCDLRYYPAQQDAMPTLNHAKQILDAWSE